MEIADETATIVYRRFHKANDTLFNIVQHLFSNKW